ACPEHLKRCREDLTREVMSPPNNFFRARVGLAFGLSGYLFVANPAFAQRRAPAESVGSSAGAVTLGGWVRADYGPGAPGGVTVRLETNEGLIGGEQPVNTSGYFEFVGLAKTYYRLTVTAPGFQSYQRDLDLRSVGDRLVVNVQLSPALKSKAPPPPASLSFTDSKASKEARKEYEQGERA